MSLQLQSILRNALESYSDQSKQVWAKLYYIIKDECVGKVFLRENEIVINNTSTDDDGHIVGLRGFGNKFIRKSTKHILDELDDGLMIKRDRDGNIYVRKKKSEKLTDLIDAEVVGWQEPKRHCHSADLISARGKITDKKIKIFDMSEYMSHVVIELGKSRIDEKSLEELSVVFVRLQTKANLCRILENGQITNSVDDQLLICIVNFSALDVIRNKKVIIDAKEMSHLDLSNCSDVNVRRNWCKRDFEKRSQGGGGGGGREEGWKTDRNRREEIRREGKNVGDIVNYSWLRTVNENNDVKSQSLGSAYARNTLNSDHSYSVERKEWSAIMYN